MKVTKVEQFLYVCPACAEEGHGEGQPIDAFYTWPAEGYADGQRSYLCRRHTDQVNTARQRRRLDPESPDYDPTYHEKVKAWKRAYARRKLDPESPDYDPDLHERQKLAKRKRKNRQK